MVHRADRVITCSHYMQGHVADIFGIEETRVTVIPNGIDPLDLQTVDDLATLRANFARPDERLVILVPGHARGRAESAGDGAGGLDEHGTFRAGSATTSRIRSTGSPTCA